MSEVLPFDGKQSEGALIVIKAGGGPAKLILLSVVLASKKSNKEKAVPSSIIQDMLLSNPSFHLASAKMAG